MDCFKLRTPTIADWENVWNCFSASQRDVLHWRPTFPKDENGKPGAPNYREFHLSDPDENTPHFHCCAGGREADGKYAVAPSDYKLQFRPVLEAEKDISCLKDGTIIQMGSFMAGTDILPIPGEDDMPPVFPAGSELNFCPYELDGAEPVSWIKCGNILMADRPVVSGISFDQLKQMNLVKGFFMDTPFQAVAANYFYDLSMSQPFSSQRQLGDIMADLHRELEYNTVADIPERNILFAISSRIQQALYNDENLNPYRIVLAVSTMLTRGLDSFYYYDQDKSHRIADFSPEVLRTVLSTCLQDEFEVLLDDTMDCVIERKIADKDGQPTATGRVLACLEQVEKALESKFEMLETMVESAGSRANFINPVKKSPGQRGM